MITEAITKMKKSSLYSLNSTIKDLSVLISEGNISPVDLIDSTLDRIEELNPKLNAYITVLKESAREEAKASETLIGQGEYKGPLHGIPISLKDLIYVKGIRSTSGSKILSDFIPSYNATVVDRLRNAGAIIIGMNNTHEFACGVTNVNPHYGTSINPWDTNRLSGGSSGGSAVAVSAGMTSASIGTDTSGSIRIPSSLCGLFGLKPTYGRVSKYGVMELAPSIDHVGPIARSAWDIAAILKVISGYDELDQATINMPVPNYIEQLSEDHWDKKRFKIGIPKQYFFDVVDEKVMRIFDRFLNKLQELEISTFEVDIEDADKIYDTWKAFRLGESAAVHEKWIKSRHDDYGQNVISMLERGLDVRAVDYINAHKEKQKIKNSILNAIKDYDALLVPTTAVTAPLLEQDTIDVNGKIIDVYSILSRLTTVFDVTGLPALNVPAGLVEGSLPIGVQLVARPFDETTILQIAYKYEQYYNISNEMVPPLVHH